MMKKKLVSGILALAIAFTSVTVPDGIFAARGADGLSAAAEEYETYYSYGDYTYKILDDGTVEIKGYYGGKNETELEIPSEIDGKKVTSIEGAFKKCTALKSIKIPDGVINIGEWAFSGCTALTSMNIPDSVISIGYGGFSDCTALTSINIPDSVTSIGGAAFSGCTALTGINIPDSVTSIGSRAFEGCTSLTSIKIPDGVTSIGESAFYECASLESVTIPDSVTSIDRWAFCKCTSLVNITIPYGVTSIGYEAFYKCTSLTSLSLPDSVTSIGASVFRECTSLTSITIPDSVVEIGGTLFAGCSKLTNVILPKNITALPSYYDGGFFEKCTSLTSITIPTSVKSIGSNTFSGCTSLKSITIPDSVTEINSHAFSGCTSLKSITIPDSVTEINSYVFSGCTSLKSITIPDSVTEINSYAFSSCTSLASFNIPTDVKYISSFAFYNCALLKSIRIPYGVTSIGAGAFSGCTSLESINIPDGVTSIGGKAFYDTAIINKQTTPLKYIGGWLVMADSNIESADIKAGITKISDSAFSGLTSLKSVTIPDSVTSMGKNAFEGCTSLENVTIGKQLTKIDDYTFKRCTSLKSITIPDGVTSIGAYVFIECTSLTSVNLPNSLTSIGTMAFYLNPQIKNIEIPASVKSIGHDAFGQCPSLEAITVSKDNADYCSSDGVLLSKDKTKLIFYPLGKKDKKYYMPYGVNAFSTANISVGMGKISTNVGLFIDNPFIGIPYGMDVGAPVVYKNETLKHIELPKSMTIIGEGYFAMLGIESIAIPSTVTKIGDCAFFGCGSLTDIYYGGTEEQWNNISIGSFNSALNTATIHYSWKHTHNYYKASYTWSSDNKTCTASRICICCGNKETEKATATSKVTAATCTAAGKTVYTATFKNTVFKTQTKTVAIKATGHSFGAWKTTKAATYFAKGVKTRTCTKCGTKETKDIAKKTLAQVKGVKVSAQNDTTITLKWTKVSGATGYVVEKKVNGEWKKAATIGKGTTVTAKITKLKAGTSYTFRVRATVTSGTKSAAGANSTTISAATKPSKVTGLKASAKTTTSITLKWTKNTSGTGYTIQQYKNSKWTTIKTITKNTTVSFKVTGLKAGKQYKFRVCANKVGQSGAYSSKLTVYTNPSKVTGLKASAKAKNTITLKWDKNTGGTGYEIQMMKNGKWVTIKTITKNSTVSYKVTGLKAKTTYKFRVRAYRGKQYGAYSATLTASTTK